MGLIEKLMGFVSGVAFNPLSKCFVKIRKNQLRAHVLQQAALTQFATEFRNPRSGFDRFIDGVNVYHALPWPLVCWAFSSRRWWIPFGLPIAWRAYRLCLNPYGGYWARLCPFILARVIKAKALKYAPKTCKNRPKPSHKPFKQAQ